MLPKSEGGSKASRASCISVFYLRDSCVLHRVWPRQRQMTWLWQELTTLYAYQWVSGDGRHDGLGLIFCRCILLFAELRQQNERCLRGIVSSVHLWIPSLQSHRPTRLMSRQRGKTWISSRAPGLNRHVKLGYTCGTIYICLFILLIHEFWHVRPEPVFGLFVYQGGFGDGTPFLPFTLLCFSSLPLQASCLPGSAGRTST